MDEPKNRPEVQRVVRSERMKEREPAVAALNAAGRVVFPTGYPETMRRAARGELPLPDYLSSSRDNPQEIATLAAAFYAANRLEEARVLFDGLCRMDEKDARYQNALGAVWLRLRKPEEALNALNRALQLDEANIDAWVNRAEAYLVLKHFDAAASDLRHAIALDPGKNSPAANRARQFAWGMHQLCQADRRRPTSFLGN
jgi:tetratricopeptide (TPR) repeat protein